MTRETKLGLVVGCSFVCLTAVVVATRLTQADEKPADAAPSNAVQAKTPSASSGPPKPATPPNFPKEAVAQAAQSPTVIPAGGVIPNDRTGSGNDPPRQPPLPAP